MEVKSHPVFGTDPPGIAFVFVSLIVLEPFAYQKLPNKILLQCIETSL
jgi:hypothetical protein